MAISEEERREIARKLRELPARAVYDMAITLHCLIWPPNITYTGIDQLFARLADLIDRETCHLVEDEEGCTACSECGCAALYMLDASYCPDCGRKVVRDGD